MVYVKKKATICKICASLLDKKLHCTFMVCGGSARIRNCGVFCRMRHDFCQTRRNLANAPHFRGKRCRNPAKAEDCGALQDGALRHGHQKCDAFDRRKAAHMPPCFQVPRRHVCCIIFDVPIYIAYTVLTLYIY